jgi:hypothetical protein
MSLLGKRLLVDNSRNGNATSSSVPRSIGRQSSRTNICQILKWHPLPHLVPVEDCSIVPIDHRVPNDVAYCAIVPFRCTAELIAIGE